MHYCVTVLAYEQEIMRCVWLYVYWLINNLLPMTRKGKMILILFLVSLVIIILRENGYLNLRWYRSNVRSAINAHWVNNIGQASLPKDYTIMDSCSRYVSVKDMPLMVFCRGNRYGQEPPPGCYPVSVFIEGIEHGSLWMPLYKDVTFKCMFSLNRGLQTYRQYGDSVLHTHYLLSGTIIVNGSLTIKGFCSHYNAERILFNHLMSVVYKEVREQMDKQP